MMWSKVFRTVAALVVVAVAVAQLPAVEGCGKWIKSTPIAPVPDKAVKAAWANHHVQVEGYFCACRNTTGALQNTDDGFGAGWKCWIRQNGNNNYCKVGEYSVLASAFPAYNNPVITNTTSTRPVPKGSIPAPNTNNAAFSCVQIANGVEGVSGVLPGSLSIDPNSGAYVCQTVYVSWKTYMTTVFSEANAGSYAAITGAVCPF